MENALHKALAQVLRIVPNMVLNTLSLNVSFAVEYLSGSAGVILTSVNLVIRDKMRVTMCLGMKGAS